MTSQIYLKDFDQVYDETYLDVLRFIVCNSININDVNDILQEVYMELFKILKKKNLDNINIKSYVISIAANKIKKYYSLIYKISKISLFTKDEYDIELIDKIKDDIDIERLIVNKNEWEKIWLYIKNKSNQNIPKIFYLYYNLDLTIKQISKELNLSESYVKNILYRTLKELYSKFNKECDYYEKLRNVIPCD